MKKNSIIIAGFICCSCNNAPKKPKEPADTSNQNQINIAAPVSQAQFNTLAKKLIGAWTGGESENATFDISKDSIYYVDKFESYRYALKHDSIKIFYPDFVYTAKVYFIKDTLVMNSKDFDVTKFWKFKN